MSSENKILTLEEENERLREIIKAVTIPRKIPRDRTVVNCVNLAIDYSVKFPELLEIHGVDKWTY